MSAQWRAGWSSRKAGRSISGNARDLYHFLGVARDFSNWIKKRLKDGGFVLGQNYLLTKTGAQVPAFDPPNLANQNQRGGDRRSTDYHLTLETAKHIGMMERNDKGHEVRRYFIECERRLLEGAQAQIPDALPQEIQDAIDHKAHLLSVQSFERIRAALAELAREHLREGEPVAKVIKRLEQGTPQIGDMHLIQADDLWPLTSTMANLAFALSIVMEAPMDALHRLEARTGRRWYNRQG